MLFGYPAFREQTPILETINVLDDLSALQSKAPQRLVRCSLKPLATSCHNSCSEDRALDLISNPVEGVHQGLGPDLENLVHKLPDCFLGLRTGRIMWYRRRGDGRGTTAGGARRDRGRLVKEQKADIGTSEEAAYMGIGRRIRVDMLQIPVNIIRMVHN